MLNIGIIAGSTRPGRKSQVIAQRIVEIANHPTSVAAGRAQAHVLDLADYNLPLLDEPVPAIMGDYRKAHTKEWARAVSQCDGFIFVTPEYNHSIPAALKNALDFLYAEWTNKAAGFVGYGGSGGIRAVEQLRLILSELCVATVRAQVTLSPQTSQSLFIETNTWQPETRTVSAVQHMLADVMDWAEALKTLRNQRAITGDLPQATHPS